MVANGVGGVRAPWRPPEDDRDRYFYYAGIIFARTTEELLAAIRRLPLEERRRVLEKSAQEFLADTPEQPVVQGREPS
jgi:hypothetical protein